MMRSSRAAVAPVLLLAILLPFRAATAQQGDWNSARALELVEGARLRRTVPVTDGWLQSYEAQARGWVYFYLDRVGSDERTLVKTDQVALEIFWAVPNLTQQRILGLRDESRLPNRMYYHLDHLTVVQDNFGDLIRLGDGDEVASVLHPAAFGSDTVYDFRLADSLTLRLPGAAEPVRVYELQVRPRRVDRPAFVGSIFVDRAEQAIVRMTFTFTPASYVDRRLDYINISLDNGLWEGRYWLPHEQRLEIRREVPELDFPAGAVIRGVMRIGDYRFNVPLPSRFYYGPRVVALPKSMREAFPFEEDLYAGLAEEGLAPPPGMAELRRQAAELIRQRALSGLPRLRLHLPNASSALRYDRAEGLFLGAGLTWTAGNRTSLDAAAGYAFGRNRVSGSTVLHRQLGTGSEIRLRLGLDEPRDIGPFPGAPAALNTLAGAFTGTDWIDPYAATGAGIEFDHALGRRWSAHLSLAAERHESLQRAVADPLFTSDTFRTVLPVAEGTLRAATLSLRRAASPGTRSDWAARLALEGGTLAGDAFARSILRAEHNRRTVDQKTRLEVTGVAGLALGDNGIPAQRLFLLGGRGTLPGYAYRSIVADRFALIGLQASHQIRAPWLSLRASAAAGWTDLDVDPPAGWPAPVAGGLRASVGIGLGFFDEVGRLDLARGLHDGGEWQLLFSIDPRLWGIL